MTRPDTSPRPFATPPKAQMTLGCLVIPALLMAVMIGAYVYVQARATDRFVVPDREVVWVRTQPDDRAPLLARFGPGRTMALTGRSEDWRWLEVELWDGGRGWTRRPLSILVWQLDAAPKIPNPSVMSPLSVVPVAEDMVAISATAFTMGSPPGMGENDEHPAHVVRLSAFAIDRTEVTAGQYWQCVAAGVCIAPMKKTGRYMSDPAFDNHPAIDVPWQGAHEYCHWRGKRLPTEAEWEAAAGWDQVRRAKLLWPWGHEAQQRGVNAGEMGREGPVAVGSTPADQSPAGVLDMGGNVSEWVFDWYKIDAYRVSAETDPVGPIHRRSAGTSRVVRGGSFADALSEARTANRRHREAGYGYPTIGFRCAKSG